jgi:site-specific DNA recombinase
MTWASYARVSSDGQTGLDRYGFERQQRDNERYVRRFGHDGEILEFKDVISGTKENRAEFEQLLASARAKKVSKVCIPETDRLARDPFVGAALIVEMWDAGLEVHNSLKGLISRTDGESRRAFFRDLLDADTELERITRRMYGGRVAKIASGQLERPLGVYGWKNGQIDPEQHKTLLWIAQRTLEVGIARVATELNAKGILSPRGGLWHHSTVRQLLRNRTLVGEWSWGRKSERMTLPVTPLLELELFEAVNAKMSSRHRGQGRMGSRIETYLLQGRIRCGACGYSMTGWEAQRNHKNAYYVCSLARQPAKACLHTTCYRLEDIHDFVMEQLRGVLESGDIQSIARTVTPAPDTTAERKRLNTRLERARAAYLAGVDTLEQYQKTKTELEQLLKALETAPVASAQPNPERAQEIFKKVMLEEQLLSEIAKRLALTVRVGPGGVISLELGI